MRSNQTSTRRPQKRIKTALFGRATGSFRVHDEGCKNYFVAPWQDGVQMCRALENVVQVWFLSPCHPSPRQTRCQGEGCQKFAGSKKGSCTSLQGSQQNAAKLGFEPPATQRQTGQCAKMRGAKIFGVPCRDHTQK